MMSLETNTQRNPSTTMYTYDDSSIEEEHVEEPNGACAAGPIQGELKETTMQTATTGQEAFKELRKIIVKNKAYLSPQFVPEIDSAFNSVQEAHKTMKEDCDDLIILAGKIRDYTHYFPEEEKRKIEECFKQMLTHEGMCQINKKRRIPDINLVEVDTGAKLSITDSVVIIKYKNSTGLTVNINNIPVFDDYFKKKDAKIVEASKSSIKLLVRFASQQAMKKFEMECDKGITEREIYELLLKNKLIEPGAEIKVTVKTGHGALLIISMEEFEKVNKESIDLVPFMVAAYNCKNMEQLDSNLASMLEKRITASDLQSRYHIDQEQTTDSESTGSRVECLFPTLLHFTASYGLMESFHVLKQKPEGKEALKTMNRHGNRPVDMFERATYTFYKRRGRTYEIQQKRYLLLKDEMFRCPGCLTRFLINEVGSGRVSIYVLRDMDFAASQNIAEHSYVHQEDVPIRKHLQTSVDMEKSRLMKQTGSSGVLKVSSSPIEMLPLDTEPISKEHVRIYKSRVVVSSSPIEMSSLDKDPTSKEHVRICKSRDIEEG